MFNPKRFFLTVLLSSTLGYAQPWTVQTAAFRDLDQAQTRVVELRALGFDAYSEFAMLGGKQYARVRVGCAFERAGAAALARSLQRVTREAVVVPLSEGAEVSMCVAFDVGFRLPERWGVLGRSPDAVRFWVEVGGRRGAVAYTLSNSVSDAVSDGVGNGAINGGGQWQLLQNENDPLLELPGLQGNAPATPKSSVARFAAAPNGDISVTTPSGHSVVGRGDLLWSGRGVGVACVGDEVVAIRLLKVPRSDAP